MAGRFGAMPNNLSYNPQQGPYNPGYVLGPKAQMSNQISTAPNSVMTNRYDAFQKNMEKWFPYLGFPSKPIVLDPYDDYSRENFDLPEAYYNTQNFSVSLLLINRIMAADAYHVTEMLPWKVWEGGDTIAWDEWRFEDHMLTRTPEESVSRLLTSTFSQNKEYIVRYGIAMILEHGFWNTPKGQTSFDMQLLQMENASIETACHGAQLAVLNVDWTKMPGHMQVGRLKSSADRETRIREEVNKFGILHKEQNGWLIVLSDARQIMKNRVGRTGNFVQWPAGALKHVMMRPDQTLALYSGTGGYKAEPITSGSTYQGEKHYESRALRIGERQTPVDPSFREVVIGGYAQLDLQSLKSIPVEQFSYDKAELRIYSEDVDKIVPLAYAHLLKMTGVFYMPDGNIDSSYDADWQTSVIGKQWFAGHRNWGDYLQAKSYLDHLLRGIMALTDDRFLTFIEWFVKRAQSATKLSQQEKKSLQDQRGAVVGGWQRGQTLVAASLLDDEDEPEIDTEARGLFGMAKEYKSMEQFQAAVQNLRTPFSDQLLCYVTVLARAFPQLPMTFNATVHADVAALKIVARYVTDDETSLQSSVTSTVRNCLIAEAHKGWDWGAARAHHALVNAERHIRELTFIPSKDAVGHVAAVAADLADPIAEAPDMVQIARNATAYMRSVDGAIPMLYYDGGLMVNPITGNADNWFRLMARDDTVIFANGSARLKLLYLVTILNTRYATWRMTPEADRPAMIDAAVARLNTTVLNGGTELQRAFSGGGMAPGAITAMITELKKPHVLPPYQWHLLPVLEVWKQLLSQVLASESGSPLNKFVTAAQLQAAFNKILPSKFYLTSKTPSLGVASRMSLLEKKRRDHVRALTMEGVGPVEREGLLAMWTPAVMERYKPVFDAIEVVYRNLPSACEALFRRRVLTFLVPESAAVSKAVLQDRDQDIMSATEFIYFMSLVETIWEEDWNAAGADEEKRQVAVDKMALIIEEMYLSHNTEDATARRNNLTPDLWRVLKREFADVWDPQTQSVDDFLRKAANNNAAASLKNTIRETQKSLLLRVKSLGSRYFSQLERQMPAAIRRRLVANEQDAKSGSMMLQHDSMEIKGLSDAMDQNRGYRSAPSYGSSLQLSGMHPGNAGGALSLGGRISTSADEMREVRRMFGTERLAAVLRSQPLTSKLVRFGLLHNLPPVIGLGLLRPHEIYVMGTVVYMAAGGEAGWTFRGHENFMLQNDAMRKLIFGHFTMYLKSLVMRPELVVHIENVISQEYVGGCGHSCWNPLDKYDRQAYHEGEMAHSCFVFPMDPNEKLEKPTIDITGRFHPDLQGPDEQNALSLHYRAAQILSHVWRWTHPTQNPLESRGFGPNASIRYNTLCREMLQFKYQHKGNGTGGYDDITINQGHWGPRTYPGCAKVRAGQSMYLEPVPYSGTSTVAVIS